ncbi:MAG: amino acid ABC transporter substrate-binding protein [Neisseriaceae bacterium]|nr:amino acid ABC transporter substrate-binding protein [Neisseriaceae bacterium]MBP6861907.1 amino acid ABC transporter substrate-binding protein [Neisseriaceae bacterium]
MNKRTFYALIASAGLLLAACSKDEAPKSAGNSIAQKIEQQGTLVVGTEGSYAPFSFHDESGQLTGYDVEVIREVAKRLNVTLKFEETQWDAMFAGLNSQRFDLIANLVGITPERQQKYEFSTPYIYSGAVIVARADDQRIGKVEDVAGLDSAQSLTSNFGDLARSLNANIVGVDGLAQSLALIKQKRADITINDYLAVLDYFKQQGHDGLKIMLPASEKLASGFAFNQGNQDAIAKIDQALEEMRQDGTLKRLGEQWFGEDVSVK